MNLFLNREVTLARAENGLMGPQGVSTTDSGLRLMPCIIDAVIFTGASGFLLRKLKDYQIFITPRDRNPHPYQQLIFVLIMGLGQGLIY
ncbi:hypothetical protein KI688_005848 [Linnemannia hyalina]|uniref:Uncharacterized protein n=1 Tax=Linnemannia hyalina TaxID=64524 RepID=A0A9P8BX67_9FUNG|nr:hypothetical protein KI688_005848 [Linnemannia hyalina]